MAKKIKETDYLAISARIRGMETRLLTAERMERLLNARTDEEAEKLLREWGYPELNAADPAAMDAALCRVRAELLTDLETGAPNPRYLDSFRLQYDYHNVKAILKAKAVNADPADMLVDMGRVSPADLSAAMEQNRLDHLPGLLADAVAEAGEALDITRDPQRSDIILDRWMYRDMVKEAEATGSDFLAGYVQTRIDAANLRVLVRALRMGKRTDFLKDVLLDGGSIGSDRLLAAAENGESGLTELYARTGFETAAQAGAEALQGGTLTAFEKACDDAVGRYLAGAQMVPFGEAPLLAYLAARETECTNLRILLLGRAAGLPAEVIRSRLRASTV